MSYQPNYPATVAEVLDDSLRYRPATLAAVRAFAAEKPWRGTLAERVAKFVAVHQALCAIYRKSTRLEFKIDERIGSGRSCYIPASDKIILSGRLSVVTYLHEFGHALGKDERQSCRWSLNLFRRVFPRSFERCVADRHTLGCRSGRARNE